MGVVVQEMVDADVAGVLFTRNPLTGADELVIEASWGLGEAVVCGLVTPDHVRADLDGTGPLERVIGEKDVAVRLTCDGATVENGVPADLATMPLPRTTRRCRRFTGSCVPATRSTPTPRTTSSSPSPAERCTCCSGDRSHMADHPDHGVARGLFAARLTASLMPLNSTMIAVAVPDIAAEFGHSVTTVTQALVATYLITAIALQSPGGKLGDRLGQWRVVSFGQIVIAAGALLGLVAPEPRRS